jgi:hypothetical protein
LAVAALLAELGYPDNRTEEVRRRLAMWERETAGIALVAERQGQVVGIIAVAAIPYLERALPFASPAGNRRSGSAASAEYHRTSADYHRVSRCPTTSA